MNFLRIFSRYKEKIFLIAILSLRFPPFYIFPLIKSPFLTTQSIARVAFLALFASEIYLALKGKGRLSTFYKKNKTMVLLILVFLVELSLGIFYALNTKDFLLRYKDIYLGILLFFLGGLYLKNIKGFAKVIAIGLIISFFYQGVMFVSPSLFKTLGRLFLYNKHYLLVLDNVKRGRIYIESLDEAVFLILIAFLAKKFPKKEGAYATFLFGFLGFFALISNFRTRVIIWLFSLSGYAFYKIRKKTKSFKPKKLLLLVASSILITAFLANFISVYIYGFSYLDRLRFQNKREDVETLQFRFNQLENAWVMSKANLFLGVGLGNFFENISFSRKYDRYYQLAPSKTIFGAAEYVHNILGTFLAEGGLIGILIFIFLTIKFAKEDIKLYKKGKSENILLITSFWGVYLYAFFHPFVPLSLQGTFWLIRGTLAARS